jgi:hypothetical protein
MAVMRCDGCDGCDGDVMAVMRCDVCRAGEDKMEPPVVMTVIVDKLHKCCILYFDPFFFFVVYYCNQSD